MFGRGDARAAPASSQWVGHAPATQPFHNQARKSFLLVRISYLKIAIVAGLARAQRSLASASSPMNSRRPTATRCLVLGLGGMGSAALYHLARRGAAPLGVEQFAVGHALGSSHGESRVFRTLYHDALYTRLAAAALPLWRELEAASGETLLTLNGMISYARETNPQFHRYLEVFGGSGGACTLLRPAELSARFPALRIPADALACFTPVAGFLDAGRCVRAHIAAGRAAGAVVREETPVREIDVGGERPVVQTEAGAYVCERLIVTSGPWAATLLRDLRLPLQVTRQQKFYFRPACPSEYSPARIPVYTDYDTGFYGFPAQGAGLKVADDGLGEVTTAETVDRRLDLAQRDRLQAWLGALMPGSALTYLDGATCLYTMTPDKDFIIDRHPRNPNVIIAAGFSGHGFKFTTLIGSILADLALLGATPHPLERFRLDRFG